MTVKNPPEGFGTLTPHMVVKTCGEAMAWYEKAFGAEERFRIASPDGQVMHAQMRFGDSILMLNDEFPDMGALGPDPERKSPVVLHLYVEDVDAAFTRAVEAGATPAMPLTDAFWGDRYGMVIDPYGHCWSIATQKEQLAPDEIMKRAAQAFGGGASGSTP